jgi:hypothetical protein
MLSGYAAKTIVEIIIIIIMIIIIPGIKDFI